MAGSPVIQTHFSHFFGVSTKDLEKANAFNVSLVNDLPLFIDPFLLFHSSKREYSKLHDQIIEYLKFLRIKAAGGKIKPGLMEAWYTFHEVKQNWLGFSETGNAGRGPGKEFARELRSNLFTVFYQFGNEEITKGSHLEKLCLIRERVGRDMISDFTTNLIKEYLLDFTQQFARKHVHASKLRSVMVPRVRFNYRMEVWESAEYELPWLDGDYVILTPKDILTRDDTWINSSDMIHDFDEIRAAVPDAQLRDQLNNYFAKVLPEEPKEQERTEAIWKTVREFPALIEYYIRTKEDTGDEATDVSKEKVAEVQQLFVHEISRFVNLLSVNSSFYKVAGTTIEEARERVAYLKDIVENKGGWRIFYHGDKPVTREADVHILYRLTWFATPSDVSHEVNDGFGPADFKISRGSADKSIVEFKLASNSKLRQNLSKQVPRYQAASDAKSGMKVIFYFTQEEWAKVEKILEELDLLKNPDVVLVDARRDNKQSASNVK